REAAANALGRVDLLAIGALAPDLRSDQAKSAFPMVDFNQPAAFQHFAIRRKLRSAQSGGDREETIHCGEPEASMRASNSAVRLLKLGHQPASAWRKHRAYFTNHGFSLAAVQDVQEEMTHHAIERPGRQRMCHCVDLVK